jgi:hypothetical protein
MVNERFLLALGGLWWATGLLFKKSLHNVSCAPCFHHSWEDFLSIHFCQCLILRRANEYSYVARTFQSMMPTILLEDIIATLCQLHSLLL